MLDRLAAIFGRTQPLPADPAVAADIPNYHAAFLRCESMSRAFAPSMPRMIQRDNVDGSRRPESKIVAGLVNAGVYREHFRGAAGQCLKWSHFLAPFIENATQVRAWPTVGQLWKGDRQVFGYSWNEMDRLMRHGVHTEDLMRSGASGLNWHAWITFESGELLDLTLASTLAHVVPDCFAELMGAVFCAREETMFDGHRYYPMLAGATAIELLQERSSIPFLAATVEELAIVPAVLG